MKKKNLQKRIEERFEVQTYIDRLKYAINSGTSKINFQEKRRSDNKKNKKYTNRYTLSALFPDEDEVAALKRELTYLNVQEYIETVEDSRFPNKTAMRVFGKRYLDKDVYIKIRVELINIAQASGDSFILVMSFHFAEINFKETDFPYRNK